MKLNPKSAERWDTFKFLVKFVWFLIWAGTLTLAAVWIVGHLLNALFSEGSKAIHTLNSR
jgi:hypothetical protein